MDVLHTANVLNPGLILYDLLPGVDVSVVAAAHLRCCLQVLLLVGLSRLHITVLFSEDSDFDSHNDHQ